MNISEKSRERLNNLIALEKEKVGDYGLVVQLKPILLPPNQLFSGRTYFDVYLKDQEGGISSRPVIDKAMYSVGGKGVLPWIEIGFYRPEVIFHGTGEVARMKDIANTDVELSLFELLGDLIPPGGHMMIPYELKDNPLSTATFAALRKNVPMVATPIGFLLFRIGFTIPFRDWYISEGGHEGPRKLQFEKPLNDQRGGEVYEEVMNELTPFIKGPSETDDDPMRWCRDNAYQILGMIKRRASK